MFLCCGSSLTILQKAFRQNAKFGLFFFCSHFKSDEEVAFSQKKPQSSKHSSGAVKLSFDETDGNFCRKYENLFSKIGKGKKIYVLFRKKLLKTFPRTRRIPFRQTWRSVFAEKPKYFLVNEMQWSKRLILSKKSFFPQNVPLVT